MIPDFLRSGVFEIKDEVRIILQARETGRSLSVSAGEMVVLTGPAGSGTSEALRALAGQSSWSRHGSAQVGGVEMAALTHSQRRRAAQRFRLFYLPHQPALVSNLTVMENMLLPVTFLREQTEADGAREAVEMLEALGVAWAADHLPSRLAPESVKAVALARGFMRRPMAALLDDPLSELDEAGMAGIFTVIRRALSGGQCAILAASRDLEPYEGLDHRREQITQLLGPGHHVDDEEQTR